MPRLKIDDDIDFDELENAEYSEDDIFTPYSGPVPPTGTILVGLIKKIWWGYSENDNPMFTVLFEADENKGSRAEFNGWSSFDYLTMIPSVKFRWQPFLDALGLTLRDIRAKLIVAKEDDNIGAPVESIGSWEPGTDAAWCRVVVGKRERYNDEWRVRVGKYLEYAEPDEDEGDAQEPEEEPADDEAAQGDGRSEARRGGRTAAAKPAAAKPAAKAAAAPAARRGARTATPAKPAAPAGRGRRGASAAAADNDPPF